MVAITLCKSPPPTEGSRGGLDDRSSRQLIQDLRRVREACVEVFALRSTHPWPPEFEPPEFWDEPFGRLAADLGLFANTLEDATAEAQAFIAAIAAAPAP
jgi:hypothetical protein